MCLNSNHMRIIRRLQISGTFEAPKRKTRKDQKKIERTLEMGKEKTARSRSTTK